MSNIILITIDALRADHLGCYGHQNRTYTLDKLAEKGVLFKQAISPSSFTAASFSSIFTAS